jgi:hypothetical protein
LQVSETVTVTLSAGERGQDGVQGDSGVQGATGLQGATGATGSQGVSGTTAVTSPLTRSGSAENATIGLDTTGLEPAGLSDETKTAQSANVTSQISQPSVLSGPASISTLGDSITEGGQYDTLEGPVIPFGTLIGDYLNRVVFNPSISGERMGDIATRWGLPITFTVPSGIIPASTTPFSVVMVAPGNNEFYGSTQLGRTSFFIGSFIGVPVSIQYSNSAWTMTRLSASPNGVSKPIPAFGAKFVVNSARPQRNSVLISFGGRNGGNLDTQTRLMLAQMDAPRQAILMAPLYRTGGGADDATLSTIATEYGVQYVNLYGYILANGLKDEGLTPTSQDSADIAAGNLPTSLFVDGIHPTAAGQRVIARRLAWLLIEYGYTTATGSGIPLKAYAPLIIQMDTPSSNAVDPTNSGVAGLQSFSIRVAADTRPSVGASFLYRPDFQLAVTNAGFLRIQWANLAGGNNFETCSAALPTFATGGLSRMRVDIDTTTSATSATVKFFLGTGNDSWTQLGSTITRAATSVRGNESAITYYGAAQMKTYWAQIRDLAGTTTYYNSDFTSRSAGFTMNLGARFIREPEITT